MSADLLRLAVIIGSVREGRFGPVVARWFAHEARMDGQFDVDVIDLAEANLPPVLTEDFPPERTALQPRLAAADAFVLVTPEYNRGYPASVKNLIDWYLEEWQAKPVGFVSYGHRAGGLRSVDHLGSVLVDLHAVPLRDSVSFHNAWDLFDGYDENDPDRMPQDTRAAAKLLLDRLRWWATALRDARRARPYNA
ncbi:MULTISPECIES: NADPH-dependent FMN reductase [Thermomonospora]|uniref:NAD(P)H-dependent FMN reductase n=1 Tax=Thermomonospora cellulosilytica TaxID=1411118 RepID=A0A7W3R8A0_9ACTN|nr:MULTISPECIES: NAD(P)H-dependent oxidoreductase [Thermomonospora]MBA9003165.1 NAD(P)H-dependent FMN reductase [Thermomonospora cellulosilytica]